MNRTERLLKHDVTLPEGYLTAPESHHNPRDSYHVTFTLHELALINAKTVLDVGCWDGWLDFLLMDEGYQVEGVELIESLAEAARKYAAANGYNSYKVYTGFFDDVVIDRTYDAVLMYEVLEHVDIETAKKYVYIAEALANKMVLISLPDQPHEENPQHLWTPTESLIRELWGDDLEYHSYDGTTIPGNWIVLRHIVEQHWDTTGNHFLRVNGG